MYVSYNNPISCHLIFAFSVNFTDCHLDCKVMSDFTEGVQYVETWLVYKPEDGSEVLESYFRIWTYESILNRKFIICFTSILKENQFILLLCIKTSICKTISFHLALHFILYWFFHQLAPYSKLLAWNELIASKYSYLILKVYFALVT